jgi:hypothetical protein
MAIGGHVTQYPFSLSSLRSAHPDVSFPRDPGDTLLAEYGVYPVVQQQRPDFDPMTHSLVESVPALVSGAWVQQWTLTERPVEDVRAKLHARRRERRTAAELGGFVYLGRRVDSDRDSVQRIAQAAARALHARLADAPFALAWTCADDTELELDAAGMLGLQAALAEHGAACHARSRTLRTAIDAAATLADLAAVALEIETGWPA